MLKIPLFPTYYKTQIFIKILNGKSESTFKSMWQNIMDLRGTPQEPTDWSNPNEWIDERLKGSDKDFAKMIWLESKKTLNPRHLHGEQFLMNGYNLIEPVNGIYKLTERGSIFISSKENTVIKEIDIEEGCTFILYLVSIYNNSKRNKFVQDWTEYLLVNSNYRKESVIKDSLRRRFVNLMEREYIIRNGNSYSITNEGIKYLSTFDSSSFRNKESVDLSEVVQLNREIENFNNKQRQFLREKLSSLKPYKFEVLIKTY